MPKLLLLLEGKIRIMKKMQTLQVSFIKLWRIKYPGLSRGVMKHNSSGHNSVYNQDLSSNAMLIEIGGVDNTFEEMYLTAGCFCRCV